MLKTCTICQTSKNLTRHHIVPKCFTIWLDPKKRERYLTTATLCRTCHNAYEKHADIIKANLIKNKNKIQDKERDVLHRWGVPFCVLRKLQRKARALINHYSDIKRLKPSTISKYKNELRDYLYPDNKKKPVKLKDMKYIANLHIPKKGNDYKQVVDKIENFKRFAEMWKKDFDLYVENARIIFSKAGDCKLKLEKDWMKRNAA